MKIALDVENVLANPNEPALRSTDKLSRDTVQGTWFSDAESQTQYQVFMGVTDSLWRHNPQTIPPEEPNLAEYVDEIRDAGNVVDILTHRQHVDEQIVWWLAEHNIEYDEFISTDEPKREFDYDIWIDDNPNMFGECRLLLRHQDWNSHLDDESSKTCDRIYSLSEVSDFL